jgi:hypothetical protein
MQPQQSRLLQVRIVASPTGSFGKKLWIALEDAGRDALDDLAIKKNLDESLLGAKVQPDRFVFCATLQDCLMIAFSIPLGAVALPVSAFLASAIYTSIEM